MFDQFFLWSLWQSMVIMDVEDKLKANNSTLGLVSHNMKTWEANTMKQESEKD